MAIAAVGTSSTETFTPRPIASATTAARMICGADPASKKHRHHFPSPIFRLRGCTGSWSTPTAGVTCTSSVGSL
jgi:hypothetical protein